MICACMAFSVCELRTAVHEWACCLSALQTGFYHGRKHHESSVHPKLVQEFSFAV